jgi:hypothetical protein
MSRRRPATLPVLVVVTLAGFALSAPPAGGQEVTFSLGGGWYQPGGADFDDTEGGSGVHGSVGFGLTGSVELGLGARWSRHAVGFSTDDYEVVGIYAEPRLKLGDGGPLRPFVAGRLAWVRKAIAVEGVDRDADGFGAAAEVGATLGLGSSVALEGGVSLALLSFGDLRTDRATLEGTDSSGRALGFRLGLRVTP